jgi:hypothetical protein
MNKMTKPAIVMRVYLLCPVPEDQKPINEYIDLKENFFLKWTSFETKKYFSRLFALYGSLFFLFSFFQGSQWMKNPIEALFSTLFLSSFFLFILLVFAFIRWKDVKKRFNQARLFYEEASWFDGQIWEKPFFIIKNDKLISTQKIDPIMQRLKGNIWSSGFFAILFFFGFEFA